MSNNNIFPGFMFPASALSAYIFCIDVFIIALKSGEVIRHTVTTDPEPFRKWLEGHKIRNIDDDRETKVVIRYNGHPKK